MVLLRLIAFSVRLIAFSARLSGHELQVKLYRLVIHTGEFGGKVEFRSDFRQSNLRKTANFESLTFSIKRNEPKHDNAAVLSKK